MVPAEVDAGKIHAQILLGVVGGKRIGVTDIGGSRC